VVRAVRRMAATLLRWTVILRVDLRVAGTRRPRTRVLPLLATLGPLGRGCAAHCDPQSYGLAIMARIRNPSFRPMILRRQFSLTLPVRWSGSHDQQSWF
jgi:hypothetical protein